LRLDDISEVSGECGAACAFVAIEGHASDGHAYLADASAHGAPCAFVMRHPPDAPPELTLIRVDDTRRALGPLAHAIHGQPSHGVKVAGVTGTNGKTTTVYLMEAIYRACGLRPGLMSTIVSRWPGSEIPAAETTPSAARIARTMGTMAKAGVEAVALEVSSHGIAQHRLDGTRFGAIALTNVTQDHLDYHKTMEDYAATKMSIFESMPDHSPDGVAVINLDDPTGERLAARLDQRRCLTYGIRAEKADLLAESIFFHEMGMRLDLNFRGRKMALETPMHGYFNAMNCLTATGLALGLGLDFEGIARGCAAFHGAPGRFEMIRTPQGFPVIVDYAHTPDALRQLLLNARGLTHRRLIAVFGCGGDRDRGKRPLMGEAAAQLADEVIVTNDNPRTEDPEFIASQIVEGLGGPGSLDTHHRVILDRREAIGTAIRLADEGDVVVITGKGHEDYQIVGKTKHHFDDREVAREAIAALEGERAIR
jgi:UDP-N-acetylmuramoyl-L-alanyl-D-glutamate--2,6-diaminopimelate ligase